MTPPDRRGTFANTAVWACALAAIAALTVWKFEIWPIGWVTTETGTLAETEIHSDRFTADPIAVAGPGQAVPPQVEPAAGSTETAPPPAQFAALDLTRELPSTSNRQPPTRPAEPGRLPVNGASRPLSAAPAALPTGSDFAETGLFPEATMPVSVPAMTPPPQPAEPTSPDVPQLPTRVDTGAMSDVRSAIVPASAELADASQAEPAAAATTDPRLAAIDADMAADRYLAAHKTLSKLYWDEPSLRPQIQSRIDTTARSIYFDPQPHYMPPYEVQPGDQLRVFARNYAVPWEYLVRLNQIDDPGRVQAGRRLKVIKGPFSAIVNLTDFTLTVHAHGYYVRRYQVGIGKDGTTPVGTFHVVTKETNPKYWGSDGNVMERDDPANPLGERWLGLDDGAGNPTSYGIHGTIDPASIGTAASLGCVRLKNENVAEVYDLLGVGSDVVIRR
ncbi:MAG: L,D-transpeptidase family protein [Planctomycetaceae bacterium]